MIRSPDTFSPRRQENAGGTELPEWLPIAAGAALAFVALSRKRSLLGLGAMAGAGYLAYRAAMSGNLHLPPDLLDRLKSQFGPLPEAFERRFLPDANVRNDRIDEASRESFPASDPPATY